MQHGDVEYRDGSQKRYVGHLATPDRPNGAAVLIAHGGPGVSDHEREIAVRLAELGYVALAADYHGDGQIMAGPAFERRMAELVADPTPLRVALGAGLAMLHSQPGVTPDRVAAIGYCLGGFAALEFARGGADVPAVVGFHSLLPTQRAEEARQITGRVLVLVGTRDPFAPAADRAIFEQHMDAAGVDWQMVVYGDTEHGFTMTGASAYGIPGVSYSAASDRRSWQAMLTLFEDTIGGPAAA